MRCSPGLLHLAGVILNPTTKVQKIIKNQIYLLFLCKKLNVFRIYESLENKRITLTDKKPIFAIIVSIRKIMKGLTEREKIILFAAAVQSLQEKKILWADLYFLSRDRAADSIARVSASPTSVSTWKNSAKVQNFMQKCLTGLNEWIDELKQKAITNYLQNEVTNIFSNDGTGESDQDGNGEKMEMV